MPDIIRFSSPLSFTQDITYCICLVNIIIIRYPHVRIANLFFLKLVIRYTLAKPHLRNALFIHDEVFHFFAVVYVNRCVFAIDDDFISFVVTFYLPHSTCDIYRLAFHRFQIFFGRLKKSGQMKT